MKYTDDLDKLKNALIKRDKALPNKIGTYNKYFVIMRECAHNLIASGRQAEMLPLLDDESISVRSDAAGLLFHCCPERCAEIMRIIGDMTIPTGLPEKYVMCAVNCYFNLKYGIPKDYP